MTTLRHIQCVARSIAEPARLAVILSLAELQAMTVEELRVATGLSTQGVYRAIQELRRCKIVDSGGKAAYRLSAIVTVREDTLTINASGFNITIDRQIEEKGS